MMPSKKTTDLSSKNELVGLFAVHRSAQILLGGVIGVAVARGFGGWLSDAVRWSWADLASVGVGVAAIGVVEWFAHRMLFHAPERSWRSQVLNTGHSHRRHHENPTDLDWVLLDPRGARALMGAVAVLVTAWSVPFALLAGVSPLGPWFTAVAVGWAAIANYEWTHLLVHSAYRPRTKRYRRLARNHRLHHHRDERNWFGVTTNSGDRILGTLPPSTLPPNGSG